MLLLPKLHAQLSPGDLTKAHVDLEGLANCTQCHTLGEKISDSKCLDCHDEIKVRMDNQTGYHASTAVRGKECATCHSEHHGRNFDMVRFDEESFDHELTGYELTGAHNRIDCRQCHIPDFIDETELRTRKETYLGLDQNCISCHEDVHQNTLSTNNCASCHVTEAFVPADKFNHDRTDFALLGEHQTVACIECHQKEKRNGKPFQVFANIKYDNCNSCHDDAHENNLGTNCKQCHHEQSFASLSRINRFDHRQTKFPLRGAHQKVDCAACHNMNLNPVTIFQDKIGTRVNDCIACHDDIHHQKFGNNCVDCHNEVSFQKVKLDNFNHGLTDFELKGKHGEVDCRKCHTTDLTDPLPHNACALCHTDYHEGEFTSPKPNIDCAECHTEEGFEVTLYSLEEHNKSTFPLQGAHIATPCFACHLKEEKWQFREIGERCVDCHTDVHKGFIAEKYYPDQTCENCHTTSTWTENLFDHSLTAFKLQGAHKEQSCMACHSVEASTVENKYEGFLETSAECAACHESVHDRQFEVKGVTDCTRCHGFDNWTMDDFDHSKTAFKLEGRHAEITCDACHKPMEVNNELIIQYKFDNFECVACHQ